MNKLRENVKLVHRWIDKRLIDENDDKEELISNNNMRQYGKANNAETYKFEFLDGYRGSLALVALIGNCKIYENSELVNLANDHIYSFSICGFFTLSAFLLTYRLLKALSKSSTPTEYLVHILKYFIRRFIHIYLNYLLFYVLVEVVKNTLRSISPLEYEGNYLNVILLGYPGQNYLWTIPCAIKYYLIIPLFCLIAVLLGPLCGLFLAVCLSWTIYVQYYNLFDLTSADFSYLSSTVSNLSTHFFNFFIGSQVALSYFLVERNPILIKLISYHPLQFVFKYSSILFLFLGLENRTNNSSIYWSIGLLINTLSHPNTITRFWESNRFLKNLGKCSYSFYLLHIPILYAIRLVLRSHSDFLFCLTGVFINYFVSLAGFYLVERRLINISNVLCKKLDTYFFVPKYSKSQVILH